MIGGTGGDGGVSFMSLFANEFAGPDGGNGGNGGHLVFKGICSPFLPDLHDFNHKFVSALYLRHLFLATQITDI